MPAPDEARLKEVVRAILAHAETMRLMHRLPNEDVVAALIRGLFFEEPKEPASYDFEYDWKCYYCRNKWHHSLEFHNDELKMWERYNESPDKPDTRSSV